ncbi:hypothetical protein [Haladaptatus sp. NG-SE-30]
MDCAECGSELDMFESSNHGVGDSDTPLCYPCYLDSNVLLHKYDDYDPYHLDGDEKETVLQALHDKLRYIVFFRIENDPPQSVVAFARNETDPGFIQSAVLESELGQFVEDSTMFNLGEVYGELDKGLCWQASKWKHSSLGLSGRPGPARVSLVTGIPCITDSRGWLKDETRNVLGDRLLSLFLDGADLEEIETLGDATAAVDEWFPIASSFGLSPPARDYFRDNPYLLGKQSRKMIQNNANGEDFERLFSNLTSDAGLDTCRGHSWWRLPEPVQDDLDEFRGQAGMPDYFVWGEQRELSEFIRGLGLDEFEEPRHEIGVFVEVKFTSWDPTREFYTDNQKEVFPQLQANGFDVLVFKGTEEEHWLERYTS